MTIRIDADGNYVPRPSGRSIKLTDEMIARLAELVSVGNYIETAAAACGVTDASFYRWMKEGRELHQQYNECEVDELPSHLGTLQVQEYKLYGAMKKAQAESEAYAVTIVRKHMPDQWQAAMTFLERRYPGRWKRREEHKVLSPLDPQPESGIDEQAVLSDPEAIKLLHGALERVARGLPAGDVVDADVVDADDVQGS